MGDVQRDALVGGRTTKTIGEKKELSRSFTLGGAGLSEKLSQEEKSRSGEERTENL